MLDQQGTPSCNDLAEKSFQQGNFFVQQGNWENALLCYRQAAEQGHSTAQLTLGLCYENGQGVTKNLFEAAQWYQRAASIGNPSAQYHLARFYMEGKGVMKDIPQAVQWFREAAIQGELLAQYQMGVCCEHGFGLPQDEKQAVQWYRKAAEQDHTSAQFSLGWFYEKGKGISQDYSQAVRWYQKAAHDGHCAAQYNLGWCLENAKGVPKDQAKACYWYEQAAGQGDPDAQYRLGVCYEKGLGVPQNKNIAAAWFEKAALQENPSAQNKAGLCYINGQGVKQDFHKAAYWFQKAAAQGNINAQERLKELTAPPVTSAPNTSSTFQNSGYYAEDLLGMSFQEMKTKLGSSYIQSDGFEGGATYYYENLDLNLIFSYNDLMFMSDENTKCVAIYVGTAGKINSVLDGGMSLSQLQNAVKQLKNVTVNEQQLDGDQIDSPNAPLGIFYEVSIESSTRYICYRWYLSQGASLSGPASSVLISAKS